MSAFYPSFKALLLTAGIDCENDTGVKLQLIDVTEFPFDPLDEFFADVPMLARVGVAVALTGRTVDDPVQGAFDAAATSIPAVSGPTVGAYVLFKDTGSEATSPLMLYQDGFTVEPNGGAIVIEHDPDGFRIFTL